MAGRVALLVGSILFALGVLELGCRLWRGPDWLLHWPNLVLQERHGPAERPDQRFAYDPTLGFVPKLGHASASIHYDALGFRRMPALVEAKDQPPVLATGDSFTHGDEVGDDETWPAYLQAALGRRTVNAGVTGYGLDQTILRTEQLAPALRPDLIVVGFIADDVRRSEMSRTWGTEKPYFEPDGDRLRLRNVPVPPASEARDTLSFWQRAFGWSVLVDTVLRHKGWQYEWAIDHVRALPRGTGERMACPLMRRLAALAVPTLVVAQYDFYTWKDAAFAEEQRRISTLVLRCAAEAGLAVLDLYDATERAVREQGNDAIYRSSHPTPQGNRLVAEAIAAELGRLHIPPSR
ncbi:MAG: SGNH/GDSL hydrolase family protein [Reyranella sp.]|nr:SGNH/GDSL hydrolase family protein [Reyranella sp.]MDP3159595.1 SGNH/GDSL hydrolase family protein [Reyranella sp.]